MIYCVHQEEHWNNRNALSTSFRANGQTTAIPSSKEAPKVNQSTWRTTGKSHPHTKYQITPRTRPSAVTLTQPIFRQRPRRSSNKRTINSLHCLTPTISHGRKHGHTIPQCTCHRSPTLSPSHHCPVRNVTNLMHGFYAVLSPAVDITGIWPEQLDMHHNALVEQDLGSCTSNKARYY